MKGVSKRFHPAEKAALNGVSLAIEKGEIFGIVGMSGAGKSTLLRLLTGLEKADEGTIAISSHGGVIFQHFNLFSSRTALENVTFPLEIKGERDGKEKALELLKLVGLEGKEGAYPAQLSGGEKQRVAIARALAGDPSLLFSDEATSALDPKTTRTILDLLLKLNRELGLTIVLITHQMEVIKQICTKMAVMSEGKIVEQGSVADLFAAPQHPVTKELLRGLSHDIPSHFFPKEKGRQLVRLTFKGSAAGEPVITNLIRKFPIDVNILMGGIDVLQEDAVGNLVVEFSGESDKLSQARDYLESRGVHYEEIIS